jgi:hypothetical protein
VANCLVDIQSLVFALIIIQMIADIGYKCLVFLMHVALCVWCFSNEILGMVTMFFLGPNDY